MNLAANILVLAALIVAVTFPVTYASRSNWRANPAGRSVMYLSVALASLLALNFGTLYFPEYIGREYVRVAVYAAVLLTLSGLLRTLVKMQNSTPELPHLKENAR